MEPFARLDAPAAPIGVSNIDTDQIIPARFLWRKRHDGWGHLLFHDLRFNDAGAPKPEFVLNRDAYRNARILVADRNFGCGSSREHAVWALYDYGIRAVLAGCSRGAVWRAPSPAELRSSRSPQGLRLRELEHAGRVWTSPGISTEMMDLYLAPYPRHRARAHRGHRIEPPTANLGAAKPAVCSSVCRLSNAANVLG
jgi:Aconitase C-terminal domain